MEHEHEHEHELPLSALPVFLEFGLPCVKKKMYVEMENFNQRLGTLV